MSVALLCPIAETVPPTVFQNALTVVGYAVSKGVVVEQIGITERTLIDTARNQLTSQFLKTTCEWAFWMDSDMVLPKETLVRLLETAEKKDAKMVTGIYYQRHNKHWPVLWSRNPSLESGARVGHENPTEYNQNEYLGAFTVPGPEATEPFLIHSAGFGCALIHRSVFEVMPYPWFQFLPGKCSEDFYFFVNAAKKGFSLWADPSLRIGHIGEPKVVYREDCYERMKADNINVEAVKLGEKQCQVDQ